MQPPAKPRLLSKSLRLEPCRPVCRAFVAERPHAKQRHASSSDAQRHDGSQYQALEGPTFKEVAGPSDLALELVGVGKRLASVGAGEDGADGPRAALRPLLARVHQGCRLLLEAGRPEQCMALLKASSYLILDDPLPDEHLASQLLATLIERTNTDTALGALPLLAPSEKTYAVALRAFASKGSVRGVNGVVEAARNFRLLQGLASRGLWLEVIKAYGRLEKLAEARAAFKEMRRTGAWDQTDTAGANIFLHAIHTDLLGVFVRYRQLTQEGVVADTSTFNVLLKACMRGKDARRAEVAWGWMRAGGVAGDETTFNTLIKAFSYSGQFEKVLWVQQLMAQQGFQATPRIWGSLLVACGAAGHLELALVLWADLKELHGQAAAAAAAPAAAVGMGGLRDGSSRSSDGGSGSGSGSGDGAAAAGSSTPAEGSSEANGAGDGGSNGSSGRWEVSQRQQQQWQQGHPGGSGSSGGLMTTEVFNAMMTACIDGYQGERALRVFAELRAMPGLAPDRRSYNLALKGCDCPPTRALRPEQLATALSLLEEMRAEGVEPDVVTYGTLIDLCARGRQGPTALRLYEEMQGGGIKPNKIVVSSLFKALGASGMVDDCMRIFRRIVWGPARVRPNLATFRHLVNALKENGALGEALRVYQGMREVGYPGRNSEFAELISAAAEHALRSQDSALQRQVLELADVSAHREVDLHGMSSSEARAAVLCVLSSAWQRHALQQAQQGQGQGGGRGGGVTGAHDIAIITGCGRNSAAGEAVLPKVVLKLLQEELGIQVQYTPPRSSSGTSSSGGDSDRCEGESAAGQLAAAAAAGGGQCRTGQGNAGRIIITHEALHRWLEGKRAKLGQGESGGSSSSVDAAP